MKNRDGLPCPHCGCRTSGVKDSRPVADGLALWRRRRQCERCQATFSTYERVGMEGRQRETSLDLEGLSPALVDIIQRLVALERVGKSIR